VVFSCEPEVEVVPVVDVVLLLPSACPICASGLLAGGAPAYVSAA